MSNIYIQEPPTLGKVLLLTTVGEIDVELWAKETPKACRNFIQLCMEGYYNGTIFHRVIKGFIAQGGDPTGTGTGGESIYGQPFKDEFHSRLRFTHRGLVAMANSGKDDNGSQFFFTFGPCPELQNKNTIFGKVTGETVYNMLKLESCETDSNDMPHYPQKILRAEILNNPFNDIIPRCLPQKKITLKSSEKKKKSGVKNFKLLSFGEEAEEDEEENKEISLTLAGKSKSTHDALDDPKLSSIPAVDVMDDCEKDADDHSDKEKPADLNKIREKLKMNTASTKKKNDVPPEEKDNVTYDAEETNTKKQKLEEIRKQIKDLKKSYQKEKKQESKEIEEKKVSEENSKLEEENEYVADYKSNLKKYASRKSEIPLKGSSREMYTLSLLAKFQEKLRAAKSVEENDAKNEVNVENKNDNDSDSSHKWLAHKLMFEDDSPVLAKDANLKTDEWFDITDPRNAINKRRREISKVNKNK